MPLMGSSVDSTIKVSELENETMKISETEM